MMRMTHLSLVSILLPSFLLMGRASSLSVGTTFLSGSLGTLNFGASSSFSFAASKPTVLRKAATSILTNILRTRFAYLGDESIHPTPHENIDFDNQGNVHMRFKQYLNGFPIEGASMVMHINGSDGTVFAVNGEFHASPSICKSFMPL